MENNLIFMKNIIFALFCIFVCFNKAHAEEELVTITSYYPSPVGSYEEVAVYNRMSIGDLNANGQLDSGDLPIQNGSLSIAGRVGIGTTNIPRAKLDIDGSITIGQDTSFSPTPGTIQFNSANEFMGFDGSNWVYFVQKGLFFFHIE